MGTMMLLPCDDGRCCVAGKARTRSRHVADGGGAERPTCRGTIVAARAGAQPQAEAIMWPTKTVAFSRRSDASDASVAVSLRSGVSREVVGGAFMKKTDWHPTRGRAPDVRPAAESTE